MNVARKIFVMLLLNSVFVLLVACQNIQPSSKSFDRHSGIRRIAIFSIPEPNVFRVVQLPPASASALAMIGGPIVAIGISANEEKKSEALSRALTAAMKPQNPVIALTWAGALQEQFRIKGFGVDLIDGQGSAASSSDYSRLPEDFDAVLEPRLNFVGIASFDGIRFLPSIGAAVVLRDRHSKKLIYSESFRYGAGPGSMGTVYVPAGPNDVMTGSDSILTNPQPAIDGMRTGAIRLAVRVAQDF